jgi:hypothetical protein
VGGLDCEGQGLARCWGRRFAERRARRLVCLDTAAGIARRVVCERWASAQRAKVGRQASSAIGLAGREVQVSPVTWRLGSAMVGRIGEGREETGEREKCQDSN